MRAHGEEESPPQPSAGVPGAGEITSSAPRALDVACGTGRDAVWLALKGMQVDAIDHLPDALERATSLARRNRVTINPIQKDIEADPTLPTGYDLVGVFRYLHRPLWPALRNAVIPGGYIIYETFHTRTREAGGRPSSPDHLLQTGELAAAFEGFEILVSHDCVERDGRYFSSLLARKMPV
jgi:tellurite methyltransferase